MAQQLKKLVSTKRKVSSIKLYIWMHTCITNLQFKMWLHW